MVSSHESAPWPGETYDRYVHAVCSEAGKLNSDTLFSRPGSGSSSRCKALLSGEGLLFDGLLWISICSESCKIKISEWLQRP